LSDSTSRREAFAEPARPPAATAGGAQVHRGTPEVDVVQFQRRGGPTSFSVERLFDDVRAALPADIRVSVRHNRYASRGAWPRLLDAIGAWRSRGAVNHILGDVHYLAWFLPRRGTVLTVLDCVTLDRLRGFRRWVFWLLWYWWPTRRAAQVTVISDFSRQALLRWVRYPAERIHVVPPPLSPEFAPAGPPPGGRWRLLQVGTVGNKNLDRVIEAVAGLDLVLVVVGALSPTHRERRAALGIAHESHAGLDRAALLEQYRRANMLVFASTYEGFGLPIIEAQAVGRPVVAGNNSAMPEAAGGAACLVDSSDVADIRRGIRRVMDDPAFAAELVARGYRNAARFAPARIAAEYAAIYRATHRDTRSAGNQP
jgi:glycosyltransferase involved in cell wall biosynthesis